MQTLILLNKNADSGISYILSLLRGTFSRIQQFYETADYKKITQPICPLTNCTFSEVSIFLALFYLKDWRWKSANVPFLEPNSKVISLWSHLVIGQG